MMVSNREISIYKHLIFVPDKAGITLLRVAFSHSFEGCRFCFKLYCLEHLFRYCNELHNLSGNCFCKVKSKILMVRNTCCQTPRRGSTCCKYFVATLFVVSAQFGSKAACVRFLAVGCGIACISRYMYQRPSMEFENATRGYVALFVSHLRDQKKSTGWSKSNYCSSQVCQ